MKKKIVLMTYPALTSGIKWIMHCLKKCKTEINIKFKYFVTPDNFVNRNNHYFNIFSNHTREIETLYSNYMTYIIDIFKHDNEKIFDDETLKNDISTMYISPHVVKSMLEESNKLIKEIIESCMDVVLIRYFSENLFVTWHLCYNLKKIKPNIKIILGTTHKIDQDIIETFFIKENIIDCFIYGNPNPSLQEIIDEEYEGPKIIFNYNYTKQELIDASKTIIPQELMAKRVNIIISMFCYRKCTFCTNTLTNCNFIQLNNDEILNIVNDIKSKMNINKFFICSSNYTFSIKDLNFYKNNQIEFYSEIDSINKIEEYLKINKNELTLRIGLETLSEKLCNAMGKRHYKNIETLNVLRDILNRRNNLKIVFSNIYNFFLESKEEFDISYENYLKYVPNSSSVTLNFIRYRHLFLDTFEPSVYQYTKSFDNKFKEKYNTQHDYVLIKHNHSFDGIIEYKETKIKEITKYLNNVHVALLY